MKDTTTPEERYLATEQLLAEACNYLKQLPWHPMTKRLADKIEGHLKAPDAVVLRGQAERVQEAQIRALVGLVGIDQFTPSGLPRFKPGCRAAP